MEVELLARGGKSTATIQQYVQAARILTDLRIYRHQLSRAVEQLDAPGFMMMWEQSFSVTHEVWAGFVNLEDDVAGLRRALDRVDTILQEHIWAHIEAVVRGSAQPFTRSFQEEGTTLCVQDAEGKWILRGEGQLVRGTRGELEAAGPDGRWTALAEVLPPSNPAAVGAAYGPGVR